MLGGTCAQSENEWRGKSYSNACKTSVDSRDRLYYDRNRRWRFDDLWGQYWLAGTAAGMAYCHKAGQADEVRLAGLIYAAANLKRYFNLFDIHMPGEANQLYADGQIGALSVTGVTLIPPAGKTPTNLPAPLTNFVGRTAELAEVSDLLLRPEVRLVSLTGPGGTGKTRLGLEVGRSLLDQFTDGVFFIDLAQITDPALVPTTTAHTLGIREGGGRPPMETLKEYLAPKEMLLLFDNFEQVTGAASDISQLLATAPRTACHVRADFVLKYVPCFALRCRMPSTNPVLYLLQEVSL